MINTPKQIEYWLTSAEDDLVTAELLIKEKRILHGLFFCHLVIEKVMKAHFVKTVKSIAPRSHNLNYLSEKAGLEFDEDTSIFIGVLMKYQLQGRYPDYNPLIPDSDKANAYFNQTKILFKCLKKKL